MIRRVGLAATISLAAGAIALIATAPAVATPVDNPVSGDPRAAVSPGNVTTCDQVTKLKGSSEIKVDLTIDPTNKFVSITAVSADVELVGIVVKGGDAYNVYPGDVRDLLHSPLVGKDNKNIPTISHWFACGIKKALPAQPDHQQPRQQPPAEVPAAAAPAAPVAQGSPAAASGTELANTGVSATVPLVAGGALLLIGGGLLYYLRRTRQRG